MIQGFTINWDSSPGKVAYSSPPSTLPQPLMKKDSFPWTVGHDHYHTLPMWSMWGMSGGMWSLFMHGSTFPTAYKLFHCTVRVITEQMKEETQMMLCPQTKTCMVPSVSYRGPIYGETVVGSSMGRCWDTCSSSRGTRRKGWRAGLISKLNHGSITRRKLLWHSNLAWS